MFESVFFGVVLISSLLAPAGVYLYIGTFVSFYISKQKNRFPGYDILVRKDFLRSTYGKISHYVFLLLSSLLIIVCVMFIFLLTSHDDYDPFLGFLTNIINVYSVMPEFLLVIIALFRIGIYGRHSKRQELAKRLTNRIDSKISLFALVKREIMIPLSAVGVWFVMWMFVNSFYTATALKPVIYLYPEQTTEISVQLDYQGELIADYPTYNESYGGWKVTAEPDGTLLNTEDGREYSYIFWEGIPANQPDWDFESGFVVRGEDTVSFLQGTLPEIGLTPKEYNEFIVFWYPRMMNNKYNLIHFADNTYTDTAPLHITPEPDSVLRVFMVYKELNKPVSIAPQYFDTFDREGFSVVEWGGAEVR